jgi:hypothetical protein
LKARGLNLIPRFQDSGSTIKTGRLNQLHKEKSRANQPGFVVFGLYYSHFVRGMESPFAASHAKVSHPSTSMAGKSAAGKSARGYKPCPETHLRSWNRPEKLLGIAPTYS